MAKDYYNILGVGKNASEEDIKKAFRKLAHQHHPDKAGGNVEKFKEINEAYQVLGNADKRRQYDQFGSSFDQFGGMPGGGAGVNWADFMRQAGNGQGGMNFDFGDIDLGDMFSSAFGFGSRRRQPSGPQRGQDLQADITLEFDEAVAGVKRAIALTRQRTCPTCSGNGAEPGSRIVTCETCKGSGQTVSAQRTPFGVFQTRTVCRTCGGAGQTPEKPCKACRGRGVAEERTELGLNIPAGIDDGETIRVTGEGETGLKGGAAGDLYVRVQVRQSKKFVRRGYDIVSRQTISFPAAALGESLKIETIDGFADLTVPAGTQSGTVLKMKGQGVTRLNGRGRGDHLVEITVQTPTSVSRQARKLLEELKDELGIK
ncbi:MAG: molecular chaperone DnaJ [Parcubacteria group bacterium]|nr:molecular chaperone DnaJ [Parcubacteria group bacterium]